MPNLITTLLDCVKCAPTATLISPNQRVPEITASLLNASSNKGNACLLVIVSSLSHTEHGCHRDPINKYRFYREEQMLPRWMRSKNAFQAKRTVCLFGAEGAVRLCAAQMGLHGWVEFESEWL